MTSFYKGAVAKLTHFSTEESATYWQVVDILDVDTDCDDNIHTNFSHGATVRATFIPSNNIKNFDINLTKKVKRVFYQDSGLVVWEAVE